MTDDLLSQLPQSGGRKKTKPDLADPMRASAGARVRTSYPKSRRAGKYVRVTATLLPETIEALEGVRQQLAAEAEDRLGITSVIGLTDVIRMIVDIGLEEYKAGRLEVELGETAIAPRATIGGWKMK